MNGFNFNDVGGYPIETDSFNELNIAYRIVNALGNIAGDKTILKGCTTTGSTVTDGIVYYNGELFKFKGGLAIATVKIYEVPRTKVFQNGETREVFFERYIGFGTGAGSLAWSEFRRINPLIDIQNSFVPIGMISMWAGALNEIPMGWELCDGSNGTPNLKGRFIVGYDPNEANYSEIGETGGEDRVTLSVDQMPSHDHAASSGESGSHNSTYRDTIYTEESSRGNTTGVNGVEFIGSGGENRNSTTDTNGSGVHSHYRNRTLDIENHSHTVNVNNKGGGESHENRPPYYTLAYIQYKGI